VRIRKKASKPSSRRAPLYFIGYRGTAPTANELKTWYDLEYGGPLNFGVEQDAPGSWHGSHGPWSAHVVIPLPVAQTAELRQQLAWEQECVGAISPSITPPRDAPDTILFAARLSRGLTFLTQGTAYDITTQQYLNPSDWKDRDLTGFVVDDHVLIAQDDQIKPEAVWWYTLGLSKFGMDELEMFRPKGLSDRGPKELLSEAAQEMIRIGQSPKIGTAFRLALLGRTIRIVGHRTAAPSGRMLGFRELETS
jgi:hypothetical protein